LVIYNGKARYLNAFEIKGCKSRTRTKQDKNKDRNEKKCQEKVRNPESNPNLTERILQQYMYINLPWNRRGRNNKLREELAVSLSNPEYPGVRTQNTEQSRNNSTRSAVSKFVV